MNALLFDIDGTLLNSHGLGRIPLETAIKDIFGIKADISSVDWMGRTDYDIAATALEQHGIAKEIYKSRMKEIFERFSFYFEDYSRQYPGRFEILPGVREILQELSSLNQSLGLLTGNIMKNAFIKLKMLGIDIFFPYGVGAFGDEKRNRNDLAPGAIVKMKEYYKGISFTKSIIIGDSHRDIQCARSNGITSVIIASGKMPAKELAPYEPDYLFESMRDKEELLKILLRE
jgi:phosphoglycolate phosphatase-like HAD superfamily hydrolase